MFYYIVLYCVTLFMLFYFITVYYIMFLVYIYIYTPLMLGIPVLVWNFQSLPQKLNVPPRAPLKNLGVVVQI